MPPVTRLFIRTSLLMLLSGIAIGAIGLAEPSWMTHERSVAHTHLLLVGWLINMVVGVAWWMFPRIPGTVAPAPWMVAGWGAMNSGMLLRVAVDVFGDGMTAAPAATRWTSAALQLGGITLVVALLWWRVRAPSSRPRRPAGS